MTIVSSLIPVVKEDKNVLLYYVEPVLNKVANETNRKLKKKCITGCCGIKE
jgi:hypothetical protein